MLPLFSLLYGCTLAIINFETGYTVQGPSSTTLPPLRNLTHSTGRCDLPCVLNDTQYLDHDQGCFYAVMITEVIKGSYTVRANNILPWESQAGHETILVPRLPAPFSARSLLSYFMTPNPAWCNMVKKLKPIPITMYLSRPASAHCKERSAILFVLRHWLWALSKYWSHPTSSWMQLLWIINTNSHAVQL